MQFVTAEVELAIEVTFDSDSLDVGMSVYDVTSGTPSLVGSVTAMANVAGTNTYFGQFTPDDGKQYLVVKAVYTDNTLTTMDNDYSQGSETIVCSVATPGGGGPSASDIAAAVWDREMDLHTDEGSFGEQIPKMMESGELEARDIASAVWNRPISKHTTAGTFGSLAKKIFKFILIK